MSALAVTRLRSDWLAYAGIIAVGAMLDAICGYFPAGLPFWMPWEFSWIVYLAVALTLYWYLRGLRLAPREERPPVWRIVAFLFGIAAIYAVVQTRYDYLSQHLFFFHRLQHLFLHHLGPFAIALGTGGATVWRGMPAFARRIFGSRPARGFVDTIQNPFVAPVLFVGLIYFWLVPAIHTRVMLDANLYDLMNWTMAVDGIFFWTLVLDPRPKPPARIGSGIRALLVMAVVPPQILVGALLALSNTDLYPVYSICGRIVPITPISDQHYGGLVLWIPSTMMSVVALILVLNFMRLNEEQAEREAAT